MGPFEASELLLLYCAVTILLSRTIALGVKDTRVTATAPVNPVELNAIFSLRCEVERLKPHQEMTIVRTVKSGTERLSVAEEVLDSAGDRVYLAVRQMTDGSTVFLLSIMLVDRTDEGLYVCKVLDMERQDWVSVDSTSLQVLYTPESEPICDTMGTYHVMEGTRINLNCSSEAAYPQVNLQWIRGGEQLQTSVATGGFQDDRVSSTLSFIPTIHDQNVVFTCEISSTVFPDFKQSCHIGPFRIYPNPNIARETVTKQQPPPVISNGVITKDTMPKPGTNQHRPDNELGKNCRDVCSTYSYPVMYWIIGTIVACVSAILFLIIGILLIMKYRRFNDRQPQPTYYVSPHRTDDIYTELECRRGDSTVYMSLGKTQAAHKGQLTLATHKEDAKLYDIKQSN